MILSSPLEFTAALLFRALVAQPFTIPSGSMMPTLEPGDYVVAMKFSYGYSNLSLPMGEKLPAFSYRRTLAKRGDVVIFRLPSDPSVDYVMRVIGLPGDRIQMRDGVLHINDQAVTLVPAGTYSNGAGDGLGGYTDVPSFEEILPGGMRHRVLDLGVAEGDKTAVFDVPEGHYFVMGDNRDNANDSRFGVGALPIENVYAKVVVAMTWPDGKFTLRDVK